MKKRTLQSGFAKKLHEPAHFLAQRMRKNVLKFELKEYLTFFCTLDAQIRFAHEDADSTMDGTVNTPHMSTYIQRGAWSEGLHACIHTCTSVYGTHAALYVFPFPRDSYGQQTRREKRIKYVFPFREDAQHTCIHIHVFPCLTGLLSRRAQQMHTPGHSFELFPLR